MTKDQIKTKIEEVADFLTELVVDGVITPEDYASRIAALATWENFLPRDLPR